MQFLKSRRRGWVLGLLPWAKDCGLGSFWKKMSLSVTSPMTYIQEYFHSSKYVCSLHPKPILCVVTAFILWSMPAPPLVVSVTWLQWPKSFLSLKIQLLLSNKSSMLVSSWRCCSLIMCSQNILIYILSIWYSSLTAFPRLIVSPFFMSPTILYATWSYIICNLIKPC